MTDIIVKVLNWMAGLVEKLPDMSLESSSMSSITSGLEMIINFLAQVNFLVPIDTILLIISIVYGIRLAKFLIFVGNWVLRRIFDLIP